MTKDKETPAYAVQTVPTQVRVAFANELGEEISMEQLLAEMASDIKALKRKLIG